MSAAVLALLSSCASSPRTGTLTGGIVEVRSSTPPQRSGYVTGLVTVRGPSGVVGRLDISTPGKPYRFILKPGFYLIRAERASLPADTCKASAFVSAGRTAHVDVVCTLPS